MDTTFLFDKSTKFINTDEPDKPAQNIDQYIEGLINQITIKEKLKIGDKVLLKVGNDELVVKYVDYKMSGVGILPYIGQILDGKFKGELRVFGQYDIKKITYLSETENEEYDSK